MYGKNKWHQKKHTVPVRRAWRKLHLAVDEKHQVLAGELTTAEAGDPTAVAALLAQVPPGFAVFMGDGAYDGDPAYQAVRAKQIDATVIIPAHRTAFRSAAGNSERDGHIAVIEQHGRMMWQRKTRYGLCNYVELAIERFKRIFGNTMKVRALPQQKAEVSISASALNRMTRLGRSVSVKIA